MADRKIVVAAFALAMGLALLSADPANAQFQPSERIANKRVIYDGQVALLHGDDGPDHVLLWTTDGVIVSVPSSQTSPTDAPFASQPADEVGSALTRKPELAGMKSFSSNHFAIVSSASPRFRETATRIMESMLPGIVKHIRAMKVPLHAPPTAMPVVMFGRRERFQAYRQVPKHVVAYYEPISNEVVMCEEAFSGDTPLSLPQQLSTIAHEGAHQILHNIGVQQRLAHWPAWLNEGLAEYFAPTTFGKRMTWKGAGEVNDWRMYELERYIKSGAGEFVNDTVVASRLTSTGYATAWALTHYLATRRRTEFHALVRQYAKTPPLKGGSNSGNGIILTQRIAFARHFGSDFGAMEQQIVAHLQKLPYQDPYADQPHFVGFVVAIQEGKTAKHANVFHNRGDAERWCQARGQGSKTIVRRFDTRREAEKYAHRWLAN